jgi:hypothetical protein
MVTRSSVISERKVWFPHAEWDFYTQSVIATRCVILSRTNVIATLIQLWFQHAQVWFLHVQCDFYMQSVIFIYRKWVIHAECNFHRQCDYDAHDRDFYTQSVILTRISLIMTLTSVIMTRASVIYTRMSWISTQCVWL